MADNAVKTPKRPSYVTPVGICQFPHLRKPDERAFNGQPSPPTFKVTLRYKEDTPEWRAFKETLDALVEDIYQFSIREYPKKHRLITRAFPYRDNVDESGNSTGYIDVRFKQAQIIRLKTGEIRHASVALFDSRGVPLADGVDIFAGTLAKVAFQPRPYFMDATNSAGVSLALQAVQAIKLVAARPDERDAGTYGFTPEVTVPDQPEAQEEKNESAPFSDAADGDF